MTVPRVNHFGKYIAIPGSWKSQFTDREMFVDSSDFLFFFLLIFNGNIQSWNKDISLKAKEFSEEIHNIGTIGKCNRRFHEPQARKS